MKLAISNIAWNNDHSHYYSIMKKNGFTGLEIAPTKFGVNPYENLDIAIQVKNELSSQSLSVVSMQSLLFGTENLSLFESVESRLELKKYLQKAILYAEVIECPVLVFGNPKNRIMKNSAADYDIGVDFFKELAYFAANHNTCLCIEPNPMEYGTNYINTLFEANNLVLDVSSKGFGMIIDSSTMIINGDKPLDLLSVLDNTKHIHLSMPFLRPLNQEYMKHKNWIVDFLGAIKIGGFDKFVSIEMANVHIIQSVKILSSII